MLYVIAFMVGMVLGATGGLVLLGCLTASRQADVESVAYSNAYDDAFAHYMAQFAAAAEVPSDQP